MFGNFSVIPLPQFFTAQSVALLLTVALLALSGCQILLPKSSPPPPTPILSEIPAPKILSPPRQNESDLYSAFRPIMPGEFTSPIPATPMLDAPVQEMHTEPPGVESEPSVTFQVTIDELNRRITELEAQLEESKQTPPPPAVWEELLPETEPEVQAVKPLPIVNKPGVNVYADDSQNIHIEITDKALFVSNTWQLSAEGEETLRTIAAEISAIDSEALIDIEGHTDSLMSDPNNPTQKHEISTAKTRAAMDFFVGALRWDAARISTSSFGRNRPIADNGTPEGRARNNRIEIVVRGESRETFDQ